MEFFLGIDGGGTTTKALLGDKNKEVIGSIKCGPANYSSAGVGKVRETFLNLFGICNDEYHICMDNIKCISMGCAGINNKEDESVYFNMLRSLGYKGKILLYNDAFAALVAANGEPKGAVLISGTGSIAYGIDKEGKHVRVGGWGHIIGDEGSAYAIARDALNSIARSIDGIINSTRLTDKVMDELNIKSSDELMSYIYSPYTQKQHIAKLAPIVLETAAEDAIADGIASKAAHDLFLMVQGLGNKMHMRSFQLALSGSILVKSEVVRKPLMDELKSKLPEIRVNYRNYDPAYGALILAWKEAAIH